MDLKVIGIFAVIALGSKLVLDRYTSSKAPVETEETKEAHTENGKEHLVNNWGTIPVIGTDRGIMGGQAVGQNVNYTYPVGQTSNNVEDTVRSDWTAYSYTLMTTEPIFGANYFGRAVGAN